MLEDRPVAQKTLIGAGAFMFVFAAAMAGTAFMISGGFGFAGVDAGRAGPSESYLMLARSGDERATPSEQRMALESWARDVRHDAVATPAAAVSTEPAPEVSAALQPAEISDDIVADFPTIPQDEGAVEETAKPS